MDAVNIYLDKIKESRSLNSDAGLARLLKVKPQTLSNWRKGNNWPDEVACAHIADLAGVKVIEVLGAAGEARAKTAEAKAVWRRVAAAAALGFAYLLPVTPAQGRADLAQNLPTVHIMSRRLRALLRHSARTLLR